MPLFCRILSSSVELLMEVIMYNRVNASKPYRHSCLVPHLLSDKLRVARIVVNSVRIYDRYVALSSYFNNRKELQTVGGAFGRWVILHHKIDRN